jgi:hypothetical protein
MMIPATTAPKMESSPSQDNHRKNGDAEGLQGFKIQPGNVADDATGGGRAQPCGGPGQAEHPGDRNAHGHGGQLVVRYGPHGNAHVDFLKNQENPAIITLVTMTPTSWVQEIDTPPNEMGV